jgi:hypothetical protein
MVQLWVIVGLALASVAVSVLGATLSVMGLGKLFTGAVLTVWLMTGSLEFAKFVVVAYLHQVWQRMNILFRVYLVACVIILSAITSMGVFGFLSDAYLTSSTTLETENIKLDRLQKEQVQANQEIDRLNRSVDEIPDKRISRRLKARADIEPMIRDLKTTIGRLEGEIAQAKIKILEVKQKVGPLIYISKAFNIDIDVVVKYLILVFVSVFDPLAICLVIAFSDSLKRNREGGEENVVYEDAAEEDSEENKATLKMRYAEGHGGEDPIAEKVEAALKSGQGGG